MSSPATSNCIFCKLSSGEATGQAILHNVRMHHFPPGQVREASGLQEEAVFVVEDIRPHAAHHLLVIPHAHLPSAKGLDAQHAPLGPPSSPPFQLEGRQGRRCSGVDGGGGAAGAG